MSRLLMSLILAMMLSAFVAVARPTDTKDIILIIGNNRHVLDEKRNLHYADDDAIGVAGTLKELRPKALIWLLVDPDEDTWARYRDTSWLKQAAPPTTSQWLETLEQIRDSIRDLHDTGTTNVRVMVYFSGHGEKEGALHLEDGLLTKDDFKRGLSGLGADRLFVFMDGCYLAMVSRGKGENGESSPPPLTDDNEPPWQLPDNPDWGVIAASSTTQEAAVLRGGVITSVILTGLRGLADIDGDQVVSFWELGRYIHSQLLASFGKTSVAVVQPIRNSLEAVVDLEEAAQGGLRFETSFPAGYVAVYRCSDAQDDDCKTGPPVVNFRFQQDRAVEMRLDKGYYQLILKLGEGTNLIKGEPGAVCHVAVSSKVINLYDTSGFEDVTLKSKGALGRGVENGPRVYVLSNEQLAYMMSSPLRKEPSKRRLKPAAGIGGGIGILPARMVLPLLDSGEALGGLRVNVDVKWNLLRKSRLLLSVGPRIGYFSQIYGDPSCVLHCNARRSILVGGGLRLSHLGRYVNTIIGSHFSYAPSWVHLREGAKSMDETTYLKARAISLQLAFQRPLTRSLEAGPYLDLSHYTYPYEEDGTSRSFYQVAVFLGYRFELSPLRHR